MIILRSTIIGALLSLAGLAIAQEHGGTLSAAWHQNPVGLDPHITSAMSSFQILENILDTLVTLDADQNIVPALAENWEVSDDNLQWTFYLRDDVAFTNGRPMTAEDCRLHL